MASSGRNAPCPCGSGKKNQHCCGTPEAEPVSVQEAELHRRDERLVDDIVSFGQKRFGEAWLAEPMTAYFAGLEFVHPDLQLFIPWAVHHWKVEGRTMRDWFLADQGAQLAEEDRAWLLAQVPVLVTVWEVREVREGEGLRVQDLLGGESRFVSEVKICQDLRPRHAVLGRVVDHAGLSVFCGLHPSPLPPTEAAELVRLARRLLGAHQEWVPREQLAREGADLDLVHLWMATVLVMDLLRSSAPELMNGDGDPLVLTADCFAFVPGAREQVIKALLRVEGAELEERGLPTEIVFLKEGAAAHGDRQSTAMGWAQVDAEVLWLETNSEKRADALRARVEVACEGMLTHRSRESDDLTALLDGQGAGEEPAEADESEASGPALLAMLRASRARHDDDWLDSPQSLLSGKSLREAVRTPLGRRQVDVLLKELEHIEPLLEEEERMDFSVLRRELGLPE